MSFIETLKNQIGKNATEFSPSPYGHWLNGKLLAVEAGSLQMSYLIRKDMTNPMGILHGGVTAGIMDDLIGMTIGATLDLEFFFTSVNLNIDYLSAGKIGETIIATTKINRQGKQIINAEAVISNESGKILAKATTNLASTPFPFNKQK